MIPNHHIVYEQAHTCDMTYGSHCSERLHDKCICDLNLEFASVKVDCTGPDWES